MGGESDHVAYGDWIAAVSDDEPDHEAGPNDTCVQLYTSGTTGLPKGAELSNRNIETSFGALGALTGADSEDVILHVLPMFHIGGSGVAHIGVNLGCTNVVHRDVDPGRIFADIPGYRVSIAFLVPALLQVLPLIPGVSDVDFSSLAHDPLRRVADHRGSPRGLAGPPQVRSRPDLRPHRDHGRGHASRAGGPRSGRTIEPGCCESAGKPVVGTEVRIVDDDGQDDLIRRRGRRDLELARTRTSRAIGRTPERHRGLRSPRGRDEDGLGWFASGDAGYIKDGFVYIHDRVKDMIVSGGENIYPAEIENAIMAHPGVADVAVIGIPSEKWGESPLALIVAAPDADPTEEEIIAHCAERLARFKLPAKVERIDAVPRNPTGKILKVELRKPYWEGRERAVN